jgi:hypothetical protein
MTDVTQAPANDTPPPPSAAPDVVHRHIPEPISTGRGDEENIRESVRVLNEKRERQWESGGDDPFAEQRAPVIERHYGRRDKSTKTLKQATTDLSNRHFEELPDVQQNAAGSGVDPEQLREWGKNAEFVAATRPDWTPAEVSEYVRTGAMPPTKIGVVTERGGLRPPIRDDEAVFDVPKERLFPNLAAANREVKNFRQALAAEQQALLAQLQGQQEQAAQTGQPAQAKQEAAQPQPAQQPQPQPQQPDPVVAQRAFHQAAQTYAQLAQMTHEEHLAAAAAEQWRQWPYQKYPELRDAAALESTKQTNPARFAEIVRDITKAKERFEVNEARWARLGQARQAREAAIVQQQQQQVQAATRAYIDQEDSKFHAHFEREFPQYATKAGRAEIRRAFRWPCREPAFPKTR